MTPGARSISDGEEVLLREGEAFVIDPRPARAAAIARRAEAAHKAIAVEYLGFRNVGGRREYQLRVGRGAEESRHTVSIELAAFAERQALLQDGPDICYQKLLRELMRAEQPVPDVLAVTDTDLAAYRAAHTKPTRKSLSDALTPVPPPPRP